MEPDASELPLAVTRTTTPRIFRASTAQEIKRGTITLTFTKPAESPDVACEGITVCLPRGAEDTDLVNDDERGDYTLIDDYPRDTTGAAWTIRRVPPVPEAAAPEWGETPGHEFHNIFDPREDRYYQTRGPVPKHTALTVDYGTGQEIETVDIATGFPDARYKVQMLRLQWSTDGTHWTPFDAEPIQDTLNIKRSFNPPLQARYLRIETIVDPSNEGFAIVRRFLINNDAQHRSDDSTVTFICTPDSRQALFDDGREFTLILANIPINQTAGTAALTITETIADGTVEDHTGILRGFEKIDTDFVFENFSSQDPRVGNGSSTTLHWTGSPHNTTYYLSRDDLEPEILSGVTGPACQWPTPELTHTTTFVLRAETLNAAGETIRRYLSTTVSVEEPTIEARTLTATDLVTVTDGVESVFQTRSQDRKTVAAAAIFNAEVTIT